MIKIIDIRLNTNDINNQKLIFKNISEKLNINQSRINNIILSKKSIDSRNKKIKYQLRYKVFIDSSFYNHSSIIRNYINVNNKKTVVIIGFGTAGLFAALRLIELGIKPIIFERGKKIRERRRDIANLNKKHIKDVFNNALEDLHSSKVSEGKKIFSRPVWKLLSELKPYKKCSRMNLSGSKEIYERSINIPSSQYLELKYKTER